ncbi:hypothetical protein JCM9279_005223 [Rhodotorula babjevae]
MATPTSQPALASSSSAAPPPPPPLGLGVAGVDSLLNPPQAQQGPDHDDLKAQVTSPLELTHFVDTLLNDLEARFDSLSQDVLSRLSSLSTRVDSLENSLADLMEGTSIPTAAAPGGAKVNGQVGA